MTCFDPDAPTGSGWWHWVLVGLPPNITELARGAGLGSGLPEGAFHVRNDYGERTAERRRRRDVRTATYSPCTHSMYKRLDVTEDAAPAAVGFNLTLHTLARGAIRLTFAA